MIQINTLLESNGDIFVGIYNYSFLFDFDFKFKEGLVKFDGINSTGWTIYNTSNSDLPYNSINTLLKTNSGNVFVGTDNAYNTYEWGQGLAKFDGTSNTGWTIYNIDNSDLPSNSVYSLLESSNGDICVGAKGGGLAKFDGLSLIHI